MIKAGWPGGIKKGSVWMITCKSKKKEECKMLSAEQEERKKLLDELNQVKSRANEIRERLDELRREEDRRKSLKDAVRYVGKKAKHDIYTTPGSIVVNCQAYSTMEYLLEEFKRKSLNTCSLVIPKGTEVTSYNIRGHMVTFANGIEMSAHNAESLCE